MVNHTSCGKLMKAQRIGTEDPRHKDWLRGAVMSWKGRLLLGSQSDLTRSSKRGIKYTESTSGLKRGRNLIKKKKGTSHYHQRN